ncbi:hypothetical protein AK88_03376 [Plasmodium fragile]|uniref:Rhoptry protein ROP14 n=1 Tax=Plasmodium fragile TaxID=5857 RepID=A0A0D9QJI5_PLAFR|nr:uncharacterized protein AK88_03376 [Plasmodium fragile]KJP86977.1 hypothetical protein AK88_03376 [Plasmodium fragile]
MEHPEMRGPSRILVNDKEVNNEGGVLHKVNKWFKGLVKNVFFEEDTDDAFPSNNKALKNTFWTSQLNVPLIGEDGLTPAKEHVEKVMQDLRDEGMWEKFKKFHSLFWFLPASDSVLTTLPLVGMALSLFAVLLNQINILTVLPIYLILQSIYSVGNVWYNCVFEIELLELVFLTLLMVPLWSNHLKRRFSSTPFVRYVCRFFVFKVLLGSSLIRFRNTDLWGHLEGKYYLYETQPLPSSIGYILHEHMFISKLDNLFCILTECVFSFFILFPVRSFRLIGGVLILLYCLLNFLSGNSYLFYVLLVAPLMFCFDDEVLLPFVLRTTRNEVLSVVRDKVAQLAKSKGYFRSFDILFCTGFSVEEVNKMKDAYFRIDSDGVEEKNGLSGGGSAWGGGVGVGGGMGWSGEGRWSGGMGWTGRSNTRGGGGGLQGEKEHLLTRATSSQETNFYSEESYMECIKKDILNALYWTFSQKGPQYILNNYNTSRELIIHVFCAFFMIIYNSCVHITYSTRESIFLFFIYVSFFLVHMIYLFFFTKNIFPCLVSQVGLLLSVSLIYTNYIFMNGFSNIYFTTLFFLHLFSLLSVSVCHLSNQRFVLKCLGQYFYFILFLYFLCFFVQNVLSPQQVMNAEYGNFQQMNVYGSFGHINKIRREIIVKATPPSNMSSSLVTQSGEEQINSAWNNYEFNCKPDNVEKTLCTQFRMLYGFLPVLYVDRLDWQFNQLSYNDDKSIVQTPWFQKFLQKLSHNDEDLLSLLYKTPSFVTPPGGTNSTKTSPIHLTVSSEVYKFSPQEEKDAWWDVVSSRVIIELQGHHTTSSAHSYIGTQNGVDRTDEHNRLLHVGSSPLIELGNRFISPANHYFYTEGDTSAEAISGGDMMERDNMRKKRLFAQQGRLHVDEAAETERDSVSRKIRTQEKNKYAEQKKKFFRQKQMHEWKREAQEGDSVEDEHMMDGVHSTGREDEEVTSSHGVLHGESHGASHLADGGVMDAQDLVDGTDQDEAAVDDPDNAIDGENLFSAVKKMEAARDKENEEEEQGSKYEMGVEVKRKTSPNKHHLPPITSPKGVLSVDGDIQKEMDEAIRNSYKQYGLLNNFSRKITKLGLANSDQGRSRYGEIKELLANSPRGGHPQEDSSA